MSEEAWRYDKQPIHPFVSRMATETLITCNLVHITQPILRPMEACSCPCPMKGHSTKFSCGHSSPLFHRPAYDSFSDDVFRVLKSNKEL